MKNASSHDHHHAGECGCERPCAVCTCREPQAGRRKRPVLWLVGLLATAVVLVTAALAHGATGPGAAGKPGLLVIAHGSPAKAWNQPVLAQEQKVQDLLGQDSPFGRVKVVFMGRPLSW